MPREACISHYYLSYINLNGGAEFGALNRMNRRVTRTRSGLGSLGNHEFTPTFEEPIHFASHIASAAASLNGLQFAIAKL